MLPFGATGGGGGKGRPAIGLTTKLELDGFLGSVPVLDGAGLGSALSKPPRFLDLLGGATGLGVSTFGSTWPFSVTRLMGCNVCG